MLFPFKENHVWGMIDEKGTIIIKPKYERLSDYAEGYVVGKKDEG